MISDDGVTTLFDDDERGTAGWDLLRASLAAADGGATFVLNLHADWEGPRCEFHQRALLLRSRDELGVQLYRIDGWEQLVDFAREFSQRAYQVTESV